MYNANVSWEALRDNMNILLHSGLVTENGLKNRRSYDITSKGREIVLSYQKIIESFAKTDQTTGTEASVFEIPAEQLSLEQDRSEEKK